MDILSVLQLFGGIGLFLFGMSHMGSSLEKLAGSGLERILETVTTSKKKGVGVFKGWGFGTGVTGIIQSSAATTIMLIGFVNAGIMRVSQALPVVFGANVGSTITAQILRLGDIGSDNIVIQLLKPASFAPMLVGVGAFIILFVKNKTAKNAAGILVGLGMLFYGMTLMEEVFAPLKESEKFRSLFTSFQNPFLGILIGLVITAILQSSSASVGILQALSATGTISYGIAIPIIIGQNLGKCITPILGGIGANKNAKRIVIGYLLFNIFGAIIFSAIIFGLNATIGLPFMSRLVNRGNIANVHFLFNFLTSMILLPFSSKIADLTGTIVGDDGTRPEDIELAKLDDMLLNTPTIALEQCRSVILKMGDAILDNYNLATSMIYEYDEAKLPRMEENEAFIDKCETVLSGYIVRIDRHRLTESDELVVSEILNCIGDFERIGDYCMNIAYVARDKNEKNIHFSPVGHVEAEDIIEAVRFTLETTIEAFENDDVNLAVRVEPLSETVDELKEIIKSHHVERLQDGKCSIEGGVSLFDLINSFERIASHSANVSLHVIKRVRGDSEFDEMHGHANDEHSVEYKALYHYYESKYIDPILRENVPETIKRVAALEKEEKEKLEKEKEAAKQAKKAGAGKRNAAKKAVSKKPETAKDKLKEIKESKDSRKSDSEKNKKDSKDSRDNKSKNKK